MKNGDCIFSPDRKYRYTLWRSWPVEEMIVGECSAETYAHQYAMFIGLNPSTADETKDDPTIRRCIGFAKSWGYGALCMTNLFGYRATDPKVMKAQQFPVSHEPRFNTQLIRKLAKEAGIVICAWGVHGSHNNRAKDLERELSADGIAMHHLGLTNDGHPKHPLYLRADTKPTPFNF